MLAETDARRDRKVGFFDQRCGGFTRAQARRGEVQRVRAGINREVNDFFICDRGRFAARETNDPARPRQPRVADERGERGFLEARDVATGTVLTAQFDIGNDDTVRKRIRAVEEVAGDLFVEWEKEIAQISTPSLQTASRSQLTTTKQRYEVLHTALVAAEQTMAPVLKRCVRPGRAAAP